MITLNVNGRDERVEVDPGVPLLTVLRNHLGLFAAKLGCGLEQCRACAVLVDGEVVPSCVQPVELFVGRRITTLEGLGSPAEPHPLQLAFLEEHAAQCGYCIPGMIIAAKALLDRTPAPSDGEIREALAGNLCRCGTHPRIVAAIKRAAAELSA